MGREMQTADVGPISPDEELQLFSVAETAERTSTSIRGLYQWMKAGRLKFVKIGDRRLIPISELRRLVERGL